MKQKVASILFVPSWTLLLKSYTLEIIPRLYIEIMLLFEISKTWGQLNVFNINGQICKTVYSIQLQCLGQLMQNKLVGLTWNRKENKQRKVHLAFKNVKKTLALH